MPGCKQTVILTISSVSLARISSYYEASLSSKQCLEFLGEGSGREGVLRTQLHEDQSDASGAATYVKPLQEVLHTWRPNFSLLPGANRFSKSY